jgi:hypothetical protein
MGGVSHNDTSPHTSVSSLIQHKIIQLCIIPLVFLQSDIFNSHRLMLPFSHMKMIKNIYIYRYGKFADRSEQNKEVEF